MRLLETQEKGLYPHRYRRRNLGSIGTGADALTWPWREQYDDDLKAFVIPIKFGEDDSYEGQNSMSAAEVETTKLIIRTMEAKLGGAVRFAFDEAAEAYSGSSGVEYIRVGYYESGCWSYVGRVPTSYMPQVVNLAPSCVYTDTVEHEIMHALGFYHEQSRPDRNTYVKIHWENIREDRLNNFEIADGIDSRGVPYDRRSVMHYHSNAFSKDGSVTITSTDANDPIIGDAGEMSDFDKVQLRMLYRCRAGVRSSWDGNCDASCPCSMSGEGKCASDEGCVAPLVCDAAHKVCLRASNDGSNSSTAAPTLYPAVTRAPTVSPRDDSRSGSSSYFWDGPYGKVVIVASILTVCAILFAMFY